MVRVAGSAMRACPLIPYDQTSFRTPLAPGDNPTFHPNPRGVTPRGLWFLHEPASCHGDSLDLISKMKAETFSHRPNWAASFKMIAHSRIKFPMFARVLTRSSSSRMRWLEQRDN
jgi:hypothetical protein